MKSLLRHPASAAWTGGALVVLASFLTFLLVNAWVSDIKVKGLPLPEYATWTGIATLDHKIQLLREFASHGPVDAVLIGASVADHGLSAEVLSHDLSAAYKRPFRVFNLSTGGAEAPTLLILYRLAEVAARPKQVWIAYPTEQNIGDDITPRSPDYALLRAPLGVALRHPLLLPVAYNVYQIPVVHDAAALRDLTLYRDFLHRPASHLDRSTSTTLATPVNLNIILILSHFINT